MDRLTELVVEVRARFPSDSFFRKLEIERADPGYQKYYGYYNEALAVLDDQSWKILKHKAIIQSQSERCGQDKQAFYNNLNEAFV